MNKTILLYYFFFIFTFLFLEISFIKADELPPNTEERKGFKKLDTNDDGKVSYEEFQKIRQKRFNNYTVTDDHLMHITGMVQGSDEDIYFLVKNSWGNEIGLDDYKGYVLVSENYFKWFQCGGVQSESCNRALVDIMKWNLVPTTCDTVISISHLF